ncbi:MAG: peptidylprolyl isomerase [Nitrosopumilus sp. H8]|nr:MAG: peptidylprolyl isomerase [Nitrosopumilus sp. H8]
MSDKIKCSHILVKKHSESLDVMGRLKDGEKFAKLARDLSVDSASAKRDGSLGYFSRGKMVRPFEDAAFKLQVGEVSDPVKSEFGYHIIKRLG